MTACFLQIQKYVRFAPNTLGSLKSYRKGAHENTHETWVLILDTGTKLQDVEKGDVSSSTTVRKVREGENAGLREKREQDVQTSGSL